MRKYQIGERVKVVKVNEHFREGIDEVFVDAVGTITAYDNFVSNGYHVKFDDINVERKRVENAVAFYEEELDTLSKISVKDKVKVLYAETLLNSMKKYVGTFGKVTEINRHNEYPIVVQLESGGTFNFSEAELEVVPKAREEVVNANGDKFIIVEESGIIVFIGNSFGKTFRGEAKWDGQGEWDIEVGKQIAFSRAVIARETFVLDHLCKGKELPANIIKL